METTSEADSGKKEDKNKEQKVSFFGVLAATKALLNPIKENLEIAKQILEVEKQNSLTLGRIDSSLEKASTSLIELSGNLLRTAQAVEHLKLA